MEYRVLRFGRNIVVAECVNGGIVAAVVIDSPPTGHISEDISVLNGDKPRLGSIRLSPPQIAKLQMSDNKILARVKKDGSIVESDVDSMSDPYFRSYISG